MPFALQAISLQYVPFRGDCTVVINKIYEQNYLLASMRRCPLSKTKDARNLFMYSAIQYGETKNIILEEVNLKLRILGAILNCYIIFSGN